MNEATENHGIITVLGKDSVGIIAKVCTYLSEQSINILDISQTIVGGYFSMLMIVDLAGAAGEFAAIAAGLDRIGSQIGVQIRLQRESIFDSMNRI